jgi:squalene-hopene/tetraprenyl-beta-curcumene cyclase
MWAEPEFTGTGFPQVFYLRYHMYPIYFPLLALSEWVTATRDDQDPVVTSKSRSAAPALDV